MQEKDLRKKKNLIDWKWQENNMKSLTRQMERVSFSFCEVNVTSPGAFHSLLVTLAGRYSVKLIYILK